MNWSLVYLTTALSLPFKYIGEESKSQYPPYRHQTGNGRLYIGLHTQLRGEPTTSRWICDPRS